MTKEENVKEDFCGACLAVPLAMAGAGTAVGTSDYKNKKKWKKILFVGGIVVAVISIIIAVWYLRTCKSCKI
tara:strand:- start:517 stop:732 length:216 start_codon:yes stop_codon:yes gene_type:complete